MTASPPGYSISRKLLETDRYLLCRGLRHQDQRAVTLKVLGPLRPSGRELAHLDNEYQITRELDGSVVTRALALDHHRGMPALVSEDFAGESLATLVGKPMEPGRFLRIAVAVAQALAEVHRHGVVHKDLNPESILVDEKTGQVRIVNFGVASLLPRQQQDSRNPVLIDGTLAYVSPEQTGRTNRTLDSRSDLYSLGITFYQMLTGRLPFHAEDPIEWMHCHLARSAPLPTEIVPALPAQLSAMVMKLLAKIAEQRYQKAAGLARDLERCLADWTEHGLIPDFPPGQSDTPDRFPIQQKLYGREVELALLLADFEAVVQSGAPRLALVSGPAGIGKSALVSELQKPILRERGFFLSGKGEQQRRGRPYSTAVQAFRHLVLEILAEPEDRLMAWRQRLLAALGGNAGIIIEVIRELELVLGPQPSPPPLPATETQNRFLTTFQEFVGVFAQRQHPVVVFLDDLQWADAASPRLIQHLLGQRDLCYLFIVGGYRDADVSDSHPLTALLREASRACPDRHPIRLGGLPREQLGRMIADAAACPLEETDSLAALVEEKTEGNPFFAIHFLATLHDEGLLVHDPSARRWRWDTAEIRSRGHSENVVELMIARLRRLPPDSQRALSQAAFLGSSVDLATLARVLSRSEEETAALVWQPICEGLLLQLEGVYRFPHDRVQQAAYLLVPEEQRARTHLELGRRLLEGTTGETLNRKIFDVVDQLNRAQHLLQGEPERLRVAELNCLAGRRAKGPGAYELSFRLYSAGLRLCDETTWTTRYELALALHEEGAQTAYLSGDFVESRRLCDQTLAHARTVLDKAKSYETKICHFIAQKELVEAARCGLEALRLLGLDLPDRPSKVSAAATLLWATARLSPWRRRIEALKNLPEMTDPIDLAKMRILEAIGSAVYLAVPELVPLAVVAGLDLSIKGGNCAQSSYFYAGYGLLLCGVVGDIDSGYRLGRLGVELVEQRSDALELRTRIQFVFNNFIRHTREPLRETLDPLMEGYVGGVAAGDFEYAARSLLVHGIHLFLGGEPLPAVSRALAAGSHSIDRLRQATPLSYNRVFQQTVANLLGETADPCQLVGQHLDERTAILEFEQHNDRFATSTLHFNKLFLCCLFGRKREAVEASLQVEIGSITSLCYMYQFYFYDSLAQLAVLPDAPFAERARIHVRVALNQRRLKKWAGYEPGAHRHRYLLIEAERALSRGDHQRAESCYQVAIEEASQSGYVYEEGLANERAAHLYLALGRERSVLRCLKDARACYARWGAAAKVADLEDKHSVLRGLSEPVATVLPASEVLGALSTPDLTTALKACQAISEEMVLDRLVGKLMEIAVENAGAQKGCLLLMRGEELGIAAEARVQEEGVALSLGLPSVASSTDRRANRPGDLGSVLPASIVNYVKRTRERVLVEDARAQHLYSSDAYLVAHHPISLLCLPILKQARLVGLLYLENSLVPGAFHPGRLATLEVLAAQAAISLESAMLLEREQVARAAAEEAEWSSAFLAEASQLLAESLDYEAILARAVRLAIPTLADECVIDLVEPQGGIVRVAAASVDPGREAWLGELQQRCPVDWEADQPARRALRSGEPQLWLDLDEDTGRPRGLDRHHAELVRVLGARSCLTAPMTARGRTLGAISFVSTAPERYQPVEVAFVQELTRRIAVAIDNAALYRQADEAVRVRDEFLSIASHELKTPMTSLLLTLQGLAVTPATELGAATVSRLTEIAERQGRRLSRLIDEFLDVTRIEQGRLLLEPEEIELVGLVQEVVARFDHELAHAECTAVISSEGPVSGSWDRLRLEQVLLNLLSNATKFGRGQPLEIVVEGRHEDGCPPWARLTVRDHGIGLDVAREKTIFDRFGRAVSAEHYGGLGLGLYICRRIVEAHGGTIEVESQLGCGATFAVELPCHRSGGTP